MYDVQWATNISKFGGLPVRVVIEAACQLSGRQSDRSKMWVERYKDTKEAEEGFVSQLLCELSIEPII